MTTKPVDFQHPAVFFVNRFGDQLLALPLMRALCAIFPSGIELFLGEGMLTFLYRDLHIRNLVRVRWAEAESERIDFDRTLDSASSCDLFVCLSYLPQVTELARRLGATRTIGYRDVFDVNLGTGDDVHIFDKLFAVARHLNGSLQFDQFSASPVFSPAAQGAAARYIEEFRRPGERLLFVHPETQPAKTWPADRFAWVLERFLAARPEYKVIVSSLAPVDFRLSETRVRYCSEHLEFSLALMKSADMFLGVDSCFLHAADLFRVPGVALFGPTKPQHWGFRLSTDFRHLAAESITQIPAEAALDGLLAIALKDA